MEGPIFLCKSDPHHLVASFIGALENLASQGRAKMKFLFLNIETIIKIKLGCILEKLRRRHKRREHARFDMSQVDCFNHICASTQFLKIQTIQIIDLHDSLDRYCNVIPAFGFNSAKFDLNLIKLSLLPILVNERDIKLTVIKKSNQFILFKFGEFLLLDRTNFPGGAPSLKSFLKAYKTSKTKDFYPMKALITLTKCRIQNFPHMTPFTVSFVAATPLKLNTRTM